MTAPVYDPATGSGFGEITETVALNPEEKPAAAGWLEAGHFPGSFRPVGHSLMHLICEDGEPVTVIHRAACFHHLKFREVWIGWGPLTCARRRNPAVNNVCFPCAKPRAAPASPANGQRTPCAPCRDTAGNTSAMSRCCANAAERHSQPLGRPEGVSAAGRREANVHGYRKPRRHLL